MGRTYRKIPSQFNDERQTGKPGKRPNAVLSRKRNIGNLLEEDDYFDIPGAEDFFDDKVGIEDEITINKTSDNSK